jgi:hypothetical protein
MGRAPPLVMYPRRGRWQTAGEAAQRRKSLLCYVLCLCPPTLALPPGRARDHHLRRGARRAMLTRVEDALRGKPDLPR